MGRSGICYRVYGVVGLNYSLSEDNFLSVQPELLFSQKGFAANSSEL